MSFPTSKTKRHRSQAVAVNCIGWLFRTVNTYNQPSLVVTLQWTLRGLHPGSGGRNADQHQRSCSALYILQYVHVSPRDSLLLPIPLPSSIYVGTKEPTYMIDCVCTHVYTKSFQHPHLLSGRCYEAEICAILLLLRLCFCMVSCFTVVESFRFWPKTMDYSQGF